MKKPESQLPKVEQLRNDDFIRAVTINGISVVIPAAQFKMQNQVLESNRNTPYDTCYVPFLEEDGLLAWCSFTDFCQSIKAELNL